MGDISNARLLEILKSHIEQTVEGAKKEIIDSVSNRIESKLAGLEERSAQIEKQLVTIDRRNRKNNLVIFGLKLAKDNLLQGTLNKLNSTLELSLSENDINNIYQKGNDCIIVEFISFLKKVSVLKNTKKLKGTKIVICNDLNREDRTQSKLLHENLKKARQEGQKAYIKNFTLYVNNQPYTPSDLQTAENLQLAGNTTPTTDNLQENVFSSLTQRLQEVRGDGAAAIGRDINKKNTDNRELRSLRNKNIK